MRHDEVTVTTHSDSDRTVAPATVGTDGSDIVVYAIKKIEKISQALYVLTNHLSADEPFRRNVREKALAMIDDLYALQVEPSTQPIALVNLVQHRFNELTAVLRIGTRSGLLSDMNYAVLESEIQALQKLIGHHDPGRGGSLSRDFFQATSESVDQKDTGSATDEHQGVSQKVVNKFTSDTTEADKKTLTKSPSTTQSSSSHRRHGRNYSKRQRAILELFKGNPEITINDVQGVIEGCSQKTMQRELKAMVDRGLLEKRGKRRWSSYVLGNNVDVDQELAF